MLQSNLNSKGDAERHLKSLNNLTTNGDAYFQSGKIFRFLKIHVIENVMFTISLPEWWFYNTSFMIQSNVFKY